MPFTLPSWAPSLRSHQPPAIQSILSALRASTPVIFLDGPTGTGKTLIAEAVRQYLSCRALYLCTSISLQHQVLRDFPYARLLKGRSNYPTLDRPDLFNPNSQYSLSCSDCTKTRTRDCQHCTPNESCPYRVAKEDALDAPLAILNVSYFLTVTNYIGAFRHYPLVIVDEADTLEQELMRFVEVNISPTTIRRYNLPIPERKTVASAWIDWVERCYPLVKQAYIALLSKLDLGGIDTEQRKEEKKLESLLTSLTLLRHPDFGLVSENWVYDGYKEGAIIFRPIRVNQLAHHYLWPYAHNWLLMSATLISHQELAQSLGVDTYVPG